MTVAPDNPAAFPRTGEGLGNPRYDAPGMTLLDYFAGQALAVLVNAHADYTSASQIALEAYELADAMLAARKAKP